MDKKNEIFNVLAFMLIVIGIQYVASQKAIENLRRLRNTECYEKVGDRSEAKYDIYYEKNYEALKINKIKLFKMTDDKYLEVKDAEEIYLALAQIRERNAEQRRNKKLSKKEIIGNTFGLQGYEKSEAIFIPEELEERILSDKKNFDITNTCKIIEILEDSIEYNNKKKNEE